ncbi:hypothetical protein K8352_11460 [Flavobacteriaceae bacterium F89]|uniref:Uncharacterized protein n=1 Tax=Cerina litoralis TaxID=2874477 RepID=A0AAE3JRH8_9FLAO|nr:hypothetical protein [Cerina litoralis]MCG2461368.1 hypothetical protein [Cerina litoralis]
MKHLIIDPLIILLLFSFGVGCEKNEESMETSAFEAKFFTKRNFDAEIGTCTEDPYLGYNYQVGEGSSTLLGKFTAELFFCGNGSDYKNGEGVFVAENGDELYYRVPSSGEIGHVLPLPYADPLYELYFQDSFTFTGGTGRFKGASGGGKTDSYVDLLVDGDTTQFIPEHRTDHVWSGTITLMK